MFLRFIVLSVGITGAAQVASYQRCPEALAERIDLQERLSTTGLYRDIGSRALADGPRCYDPERKFDLSLRTDQLGSVEATTMYRTAIGRVLAPGRPEASAVYRRVRGDLSAFQARMPPLATEILDPHILELLHAWIGEMAEESP